jgi:tetratricopeptide (TPR) repeat protein
MKKTFAVQAGNAGVSGVFAMTLVCAVLTAFVGVSCASTSVQTNDPRDNKDIRLYTDRLGRALKDNDPLASAKARYSRGIVYDKIGSHKSAASDYKEAIADYSSYISLKPGDTAGYSGRAYAFLLSGQPEKARDDFNEVLKIEPDNLAAKRALQNTYVPTAAYRAYMLGTDDASFTDRLDRAITYLTEAISLAPDYAAAYNNRGVCYMRKEMYDEAEADFKEALRVASADNNKISSYGNLATIYRKREEYDQALDFAGKALAIHPEDAYAKKEREQIELVYAKIELAQKANERERIKAQQYEEAAGYLNQGDYAKAIALYRQILDYKDARQSLKLAMDRRIAENQDRYPAPFNGSWKNVSARKIPERTEKYTEYEKAWAPVTKYRTETRTEFGYDGKVRGTRTESVPYRTYEQYTQEVTKTITIPALTIPMLTVWEFNGSTYRKTQKPAETKDVPPEQLAEYLQQQADFRQALQTLQGRQVLQTLPEMSAYVSTETTTGSFYYDGGRIELDDGTYLLFSGGVISDSAKHKFTKQ